MKKIFYILSAAVLTLFAACTEVAEPTSDEVTLQIVRSDVGFTPEGGQGQIEVESSVSFRVEPSAYWLIIDSVEDSTINFSVREYDGALSRSAQIAVISRFKTVEVTIIQEGSMFDIVGDVVDIDPVGVEPYCLEYDSNGATLPEVLIPAPARDWLHVNVTKEAIEILGDLNLDNDRTATLTITQDWKTVQVPVRQTVAPLVSTSSITTDADQLEITITVTEYMDRVSTSWEAVPSVSWIKTERNGNSVKVNIEPNTTFTERKGAINFVANGTTVYTVTVTQGKTGYSFYLGNWKFDSYDFNDTFVTTNISIVEKTAGKTYSINGLYFNALEADYDPATGGLSIVTKYWGKYSSYYIYWTPTFGTSFTWAEGAGMIFTPKDANTLVGADNGVYGDVTGFCFSAFSEETPSSNSYQGGFEFYDNIQNFVRR